MMAPIELPGDTVPSTTKLPSMMPFLFRFLPFFRRFWRDDFDKFFLLLGRQLGTDFLAQFLDFVPQVRRDFVANGFGQGCGRAVNQLIRRLGWCSFGLRSRRRQ